RAKGLNASSPARLSPGAAVHGGLLALAVLPTSRRQRASIRLIGGASVAASCRRARRGRGWRRERNLEPFENKTPRSRGEAPLRAAGPEIRALAPAFPRVGRRLAIKPAPFLSCRYHRRRELS